MVSNLTTDVPERFGNGAGAGAHLLSLAAGCLLDCTPPETLQAAAAAGFPAVGLRLPPDTTHRDVAGLRVLADDLGIGVFDLEVVRLSPDTQWVRVEQMVEHAARLAARFLLVVSEHPDPVASGADLVRLTELVRRSGPGPRVALEFMSFTGVRNLADAVCVLDRPGLDDATLLVDALHLQRSGGSPTDLEVLNGHPRVRVGYVQLSDGPRDRPPGGDEGLAWEARHRRSPPGDGALPLVELMRQVPADVPVSVEVQSDVLLSQAPARRAQLLRESTLAILSRLPMSPTVVESAGR